MGIKKVPLGQIAIEFLSVVFAVLLALGLNSLKQSYDKGQDADKLREAILSECKLNLSKMDSVLNQNQWYTDYLDSLVRLPKTQQKGTFQFSYEIELLTRGAWDVAQNNPATGALSSDFLHEVSDLYHFQDFYMDFSQNMVSQIGTDLASLSQLEEPDLNLSMFYRIGVLNTFGQELIERYQLILEKYGTDK